MKRTFSQSEPFHLISMAQAFQRKMQRKGYRTKREIVGNPVNGYGAVIHYGER
jgi:hypothetical protein